MKRTTILASVAALSMLAVPAMAQPGYGKQGFRRPVPRPAPIMMPSVSSFGPHAAKVGATVTIRGKHFAAGTKVMLDGEIIEPSFVGPRNIRFTVPAGADDGALSLLMPYGRRTLAVGSFDVKEPAPQFGRGYIDNDWRRTRRTRRASTRQAIFARWNNRRFLASPAAKAELRVHARRLAKLNRMARLARGTGKGGLTVRINRLIRRENARHDRRMTQLARSFNKQAPRGRF